MFEALNALDPSLVESVSYEEGDALPVVVRMLGGEIHRFAGDVEDVHAMERRLDDHARAMFRMAPPSLGGSSL